MSTGPKCAIVAVTKGGTVLAKQLQIGLEASTIYVSSRLVEEGLNPIEGPLGEWTRTLFEKYEQLVFVMATGIVVRSIAPYLQHKYTDPAVVVVDEGGQYAISLLSGHVGGANALAFKVAGLIGAKPIVTTATDVKGVAALDRMVKNCGGYIADLNRSSKRVNTALIEGEKVGFYTEYSRKIDCRGMTVVTNQQEANQMDLLVCMSSQRQLPLSHPECIHIVPREIVVGVGCKQGTSQKQLYRCVEQLFDVHNIHPKALAALGSCWVKKEEEGIKALSKQLEVPFEVYEKEAIEEVAHLFKQSPFVKQTIGVGCVAEPCAYLLSGGHLLCGRVSEAGVTLALGRRTS
ncbi:MAG: cobalt-precorrin 5A hydrolase [Cellulosilyticaceae bacterium]